MPSSRPVKPSFSLVVALMLTASSATSEVGREQFTHRSRMRTDLGPLADHGDVGVADTPAALADQFVAAAQESTAVRIFPLGIAGREMLADVAQRQRTEHRVAQRMDHHVAVGMGYDTAVMRNADTAQHDVIAVAEGVDIEALADADGHFGSVADYLV